MLSLWLPPLLLARWLPPRLVLKLLSRLRLPDLLSLRLQTHLLRLISTPYFSVPSNGTVTRLSWGSLSTPCLQKQPSDFLQLQSLFRVLLQTGHVILVALAGFVFLHFSPSLLKFLQRFSDEGTFIRLSDQRGLCEALSELLPLLDRSAAGDSGDVRAFFSFADALIITGQRERLKREREEVSPFHSCDFTISSFFLP